MWEFPHHCEKIGFAGLSCKKLAPNLEPIFIGILLRFIQERRSKMDNKIFLPIFAEEMVFLLSYKDLSALKDACEKHLKDRDKEYGAFFLNENEKELLKDNKKIKAIQSVYDRMGCSVSHAKGIVEFWMSR